MKTINTILLIAAMVAATILLTAAAWPVVMQLQGMSASGLYEGYEWYAAGLVVVMFSYLTVGHKTTK